MWLLWCCVRWTSLWTCSFVRDQAKRAGRERRELPYPYPSPRLLVFLYNLFGTRESVHRLSLNLWLFKKVSSNNVPWLFIANVTLSVLNQSKPIVACLSPARFPALGAGYVVLPRVLIGLLLTVFTFVVIGQTVMKCALTLGFAFGDQSEQKILSEQKLACVDSKPDLRAFKPASSWFHALCVPAITFGSYARQNIARFSFLASSWNSGMPK